MDDVTGDLEREDATVHQIHQHPDYKCYFPPNIQIGSDEYRGDSDYDAMIDTILERPASETLEDGQQRDEVDAAMIEILEQAASEAFEERNIIGNNGCWQCTHRQDQRPWWKKIFFTPNEMSYLCDVAKRTEVTNPISGQVQWIERVLGANELQFVLVDTPYRPCVELNSDGKCWKFNTALAKKKKHRKE
ncbi:hypothetical protein LCGC14_2486640 [marine sediment metagenome]|uniref:Uncharacterized protein n=1 Tax=marine sediment metagenome TaxID=412755 RepID=A0A0F9B6S7_9ZZZZ